MKICWMCHTITCQEKCKTTSTPAYSTHPQFNHYVNYACTSLFSLPSLPTAEAVLDVWIWVAVLT